MRQWDEVYIYSTISLMNVNKMNEVYDFAGGDENIMED